jgi:OOP family OmpA-OmpF porin
MEAAPAPKAAPAGPDKPAMTKVTLRAETLFDFDKATLRAEGKKILDDEVVGKMKKHPEIALVLVTGHTDQIGSDKYNQKLSERRAKAAVDYLTSQGIDAKRLEAVGKGEKEPVKALKDCKGKKGKDMIACLQPNRRVVVEVKAQAQSGTGK